MIHFFSCTLTGNLRTYIVILPIFQQLACAAYSLQTPIKSPGTGGDGRNINYVRFQVLLGLHVQQIHYWAFSESTEKLHLFTQSRNRYRIFLVNSPGRLSSGKHAKPRGKKMLPGFSLDRRNQSQTFEDLFSDITVRK